METCFIRPGHITDALIHWSCSFFLRISNCIRRYPASKRNLIIAGACFVYLFFTVHQVSHTLPSQDKRVQQYRAGRGVYSLLKSDNGPLDAADPPTGQQYASRTPTRYNVVYITLKSKRHKPAIIRGTVRPKLRRKIGRRVKSGDTNAQDGTVDNLGRGEWKQKRTYGNDIMNVRNVGHAIKTMEQRDIRDTDNSDSSIRIYSERPPPWFSKEDIDAMRFLADSKITRIEEVTINGSRPLLLFESAANISLTPVSRFNYTDDINVCRGRCGVIKRPIDMSEVFAFHLDRVLGLNRTLPTVSRRFHFLGDGQPCPAVLWDSSLTPVSSETLPTARLTWGSYQLSLAHRCWLRGVAPRPEWHCSSAHHYEWSKLALFDFLLQVYDRLDRKCCGFKPRPQDRCVELGYHGDCGGDQDSVELAHIVHRKHEPRHLVYINNQGFFDRDEGNLDFKLLEGIKELPDQPVSVLRSRRLREKLLQSLFLDQQYWESQGGRQGIEKLIDVVERRAKVLLTYINAHGIKVTPMNA